jgi:hypothetical protein
MNAPVANMSTLAQWQVAVEGAANEIATYALSFEGATVGAAVSHSVVDGLVGAHIPMLGGPEALELALVGEPANCRRLAAAMLMTDDPSSLSESDVADAVGEAINMLAGSVKRRMQSDGTELELGLPVFIVGHIKHTEHISVSPLPAKFGPIDMFVLVVSRRR